jgi:hypothetical protein
MKILPLNFIVLFLVTFSNCAVNESAPFSEKDILNQLDLAFKGVPNDYFPQGRAQDIKYNFSLDLEHGYCETAGSKIHLYADKNRWAIVTEKSGYKNRGGDAEIELNYFGNCVSYPVDRYVDRDYITNTSSIVLISGEEYERIRNKEGADYEHFELISSSANEIRIRSKTIKIDHDLSKYLFLGIKPREEENPRHLIGFGDIVRFLDGTNPDIISALENEIKEHLPKDLPKLMTINKFHFQSVYDKNNLPSKQEMYQLIAKILVKQDTSLWKPRLNPNNHWSNWKSGNL